MSSSEEDVEKLQGCVFQVPSASNKSKKDLPSNRTLKDDHQTHDYKSLRVTPTFQKHVSKHLESLLDDTKFISNKGKSKKKKKKSTGGIFLLQESIKILDANEDISLQSTKRTKKVNKEINEEEFEKRAKEVAVSGQYILSKKEIVHWAPENRGIIEIIKESHTK